MQETGSSFEKSMEELRSVVAKLESETLPLNESLLLYKRGIELIQSCSSRLEEAKLVMEEHDTSLIKQTGCE